MAQYLDVLSGKRVLLAEDNELNAEITIAVLEDMGIQAARTIRGMAVRTKSGIPIVALTANTFEEDRKKALEAGMNGHLAKPIDVSKLAETLSSVIRA